MIRCLSQQTNFARTGRPIPTIHNLLGASQSARVIIEGTYQRRHRHEFRLTFETSRVSSVPRSLSHRHFSIFATWNDKEWHNPTFLADAPVKQKEAWLESMLRSNERVVDVEAYLIVLNALAEEASKDPAASRRAERWLTRLKEGYNVKPTAECYQAVIQAWANSNKETTVVTVARAERWLDELLFQRELQPTIECYNAFLNACTRGRGRRQSTVVDNAKKAEAILRQLHSQYQHNRDHATLVPNTDTFNFVIRGWTRCRKDDSVPRRVMSLVRLMESYQRENPLNPVVRPNTKTYVMAMDAIVTVGKLKAQRSVKDGQYDPDPTQNGLEEIKEAQAILDYMHDLHEAGVEGVTPNEVAYNVLISGWAGLAGSKHHPAPFEAEKILTRMMTLKDEGFTHAHPDRLSYEKVILAWANSGHGNAGQRARWWLKKLWNDAELESETKLLPSNRTYNAVIQALAFSEGAEAAEELLLSLGEKFREEKSPELRPNSESFSLVIRAWILQARQHPDMSVRVQALRRAVEWLGSLREVEVEGDLSTAPELFLGVLRAAETCCVLRPDVLELAEKTLHDYRNSWYQVDHKAYTSMLLIGLHVLSGPDDAEVRQTFLTRLIARCSEDGLVSSALVRGIADCPAYNLEERVLTTNELFPEWPLPSSWTRNLLPKFRPTPNDIKRDNFKTRE